MHCRLAAGFDAEQKRKTDERAKLGPQFVKGPTEQAKKPPSYGISSGGGTPSFLVCTVALRAEDAPCQLKVCFGECSGCALSDAKDVMLSCTGASSAAHIAAQAVARAQAQVSKRAKWDSK